MKQTPWTERKFPFDTPAALMPPLLERLRGTPARVEDRIRELSPDVLREREGETWSIQKMPGTCFEVETLWHGRLDDFAAGREQLRPADMKNRRTEAADHNAGDLADILTRFRASRRLLLERLESLDMDSVQRPAWHPRLQQPMRVIDMVVFAAEHDDYHLARITELIRLFVAPR